MSRTVLLLLLLARARGALVPPPIRVVMKFGGSSVRDAERIAEVASLVRAQMVEHSVQPCLVCSAMGKTTNGLLAAADRAIDEGTVDLSTVRALHVETLDALSISGTEASEVVELLDKCERTLEGVALLGELSPRTRDLVVVWRTVEWSSRRSDAAAAGRASQAARGVGRGRRDDRRVWRGDSARPVVGGYRGEPPAGDGGGDSPSCHRLHRQTSGPAARGPLGHVPNSPRADFASIGKDLQGRVTTLGRGGSEISETWPV